MKANPAGLLYFLSLQRGDRQWRPRHPLGERTFVVLPEGCMSAVGFIYPQLAFGCNAIISTFAGTASMMSGISAAARALGLRDYHVVGFAGDGGTADIGLQALSGAIDRGDHFIYVCYDNEVYMNTGVQKSGLTPFGARTTTSPAGRVVARARRRKKGHLRDYRGPWHRLRSNGDSGPSLPVAPFTGDCQKLVLLVVGEGAMWGGIVAGVEAHGRLISSVVWVHECVDFGARQSDAAQGAMMPCR